MNLESMFPVGEAVFKSVSGSDHPLVEECAESPKLNKEFDPLSFFASEQTLPKAKEESKEEKSMEAPIFDCPPLSAEQKQGASEFFDLLDEKEAEMLELWQKGMLHQAFKVMIQIARFLLETCDPSVYVAIFARISKTLTKFGNLAYKRMISHAGLKNADFLASNVKQSAKEMCRNWLYKISCIEELVPRILLELAILPCYRLLSDDEYPNILIRVSNMIRGVGDDLIAAYIRVYLCLKGFEVCESHMHMISALHDHLFVLPHRSETKFSKPGSRAMFMRSQEPALECIIRFVGQTATRQDFQMLLNQYRLSNDACILRLMMKYFEPEFFMPHALEFATLMADAKGSQSQICNLYKQFGRCMEVQSPPDRQKLSVMNKVWRVVGSIEDPLSFFECAAVYVGALCQHYSTREVQVLLSDVGRRLDECERDGLPLGAPTILLKFARKLTENAPDMQTLFAGEHFTKILNIFNAVDRQALSNIIVDNCVKRGVPTKDPIVIHSLLDAARQLHDALDGLSPQLEKERVCTLARELLKMVDIGTELEQQLNVCVEFRGAFPNFVEVQIDVVHRAALLTELWRKRHHKSTDGNSFVKSCFAFSFITVCSLDDCVKRMDLATFFATCALAHGCLPQMDAFLEMSVDACKQLVEEPYSHPERAINAIRNLISFCSIAPGRPESIKEAFQYMISIRDTITELSWLSIGDRISLLSDEVRSFMSHSNGKLLSQTPSNIMSNKVMFAGDKFDNKLLAVVLDTLNICDELVDTLTDAEPSKIVDLASIVAIRLEPSQKTQQLLSTIALTCAKDKLYNDDLAAFGALLRRLASLFPKKQKWFNQVATALKKAGAYV
eukprot:TRINITY_DN6817_c0_g1_i1.p1 TRINITY_DN6817_c0_g1~~TRINITY_DN6817_c0_g1_i1.p1  ORF type:complete len:864 (-),score=236.77 TRINITY_DN6817_c0_g1_i1:197-2725(-)